MIRCAKPLPTAACVHATAPPRHLGAEVILRCRSCVVSHHRRRNFGALSRFESLRGSTRARTARCRQPRASSESNYETGPQSRESKPDGAGEPSPEQNQVPPMPESRRQLFRAGLVASTVVWVVGTSFVIKYLFFPGGMPLTAPVPVRTQLQQNARRSGRVTDALPSPLVLRNPAATPTDAERPKVPEQPQTGYQRLASIASSAMRIMNMIRITAAATIAYRCQQLILANIFLKCLAVLVLALPYIAVGGYFYRKATGSSWALSMYKSYQTLYKTPSVVNKERGASALVLNTIFIYGIFTFAILLGIVTDEIKQQVKAVRSGNYAVLEKDHIVILNWNKNTLPLVRQIALAKQERVHPIYQRPIVILADRPKAEMDAGLYDALSRLAMPVQVMARQGVPHNTADLKRVAAHHAGIIIVQHPVEVPGGVRNEEKTKAAAAACLHSLVADSAKRAPTVILQMPCAIPEESQFVKVFTKATSHTGVRSTLVSLHDEELMDRIMSQAATQPGLATVYASLLQNGTNPTHLHFRSYPELEGQRFGHIRRRFPNAVVIGLYHPADERVELNPQDGVVPEKGCMMLLLSADERLRPVAKPLVDADIVATSRLEVAGVRHIPKTRSVIVAGWNKDPTSLVEGFSEFSPPGSEVVIISRNDLTAELPRSSGNVMRFHHLRASTSSSRRALLMAGLDKAQAVIVGANRDLDDSNGQSDAHVLSMIMMIQDQINEMGRSIPLHVVGCVRNPETVEVARHIISHLCPRKSEEALLTLELLLPADFTTGLLTQVAAEPRFANVLRELMTSQEGQEIYLKSPGRYALYDINRRVTFAEVQERVRQRGELALGWIEGEELKLAPCCSETVSFKQGDKVVVLAESWL